MENECHKCKKSGIKTHLRKCPICFKYFCEDHAYHRSGVSFCSKGCSEYFFFADPDD